VRKPTVPPLDQCFRVTVGTPEERTAFANILPEALAEADASL
jgi:histidinol-phosphate/aromatic aminotransferase/cobyric acid decarboxylase-like protein